MNITEGEALLQKVLQFAEEDDSVAGRAAQDFAAVLSGYMKRTQYNTGSFGDDALSFLIIDPQSLEEIGDEVIIRFFLECSKRNAHRMISRFTEICVSHWFDLSMPRLSFLGAQLATAGFKIEGAKCFDRAKEKVLAEPETSHET